MQNRSRNQNNDSNLYNLNSYNDDNFERAYIRLMNGYLIHLEDTNYIMAMFERNLRRIHVENTLSTTTNNNERQRQSYQSYSYQNNNPNHNTNHNENIQNYYSSIRQNIQQPSVNNSSRNNNNDLSLNNFSSSVNNPQSVNVPFRTNDQRRQVQSRYGLLVQYPVVVSSNISNSLQNRQPLSSLTPEIISENTTLVNFNTIENPSNTECPISREQFTNSSIVMRINGCGHCFTPYNLLSWFRYNTTCPLCRFNIISSMNNSDSSLNNIDSSLNRINTTDSSLNTVNNRSTTNSSNINNVSGVNIIDTSGNSRDLSGNNLLYSLMNNLTNLLYQPLRDNNSAQNISDPELQEIYQSIIDNSSSLQNFSIDTANDNGIVFSYDIPIYQNIESLLSSSLSTIYRDPSGNIN